MSGASPVFAPERRPLRLWALPVVTTLAGSALALAPIVIDTPWWPPFGLLIVLGWRILRPEMWAAWVALPLGLADDLIGGAPLGSAALLWTIAFLVLDIPDERLIYRSFIDEWQIGSAAIIFVIAGQWGIAALTGGPSAAWVIAPQVLLSIFCFPMALRICARLDRWRLARGATLAR